MKKDRICLDNYISANKTNYTEWRRDNLYGGMSVEEIARLAAERFPQKSVGVENGT
jgi:hypothetical protein